MTRRRSVEKEEGSSGRNSKDEEFYNGEKVSGPYYCRGIISRELWSSNIID